MKGFALIVLCALVAVQARHTGVVKSSGTLAALGENPWVLNLKIAVSTSGLLENGGAVLIDSRWALCAASAVSDARFIWVRYGAVNLINPSLVTENSDVRIHPNYNSATGENNIALIHINRVVHATENISPIRVAEDVSEVLSGRFCSYGVNEDGSPGETLSCYVSGVEQDGNSLVATDADESSASRFDLGAGLVADDKLVAILTKEGGVFTAVSDYVSWIESETGLVLNPEDADGDDDGDDDVEEDDGDDDDSDDDDSDDSDSDDDADDENGDDSKVDRVHFVN